MKEMRNLKHAPFGFGCVDESNKYFGMFPCSRCETVFFERTPVEHEEQIGVGSLIFNQGHKEV
jgi:hypothetical protein